MTQSEVQAIAGIKARLGDREWRIDNLYHIESKSGDTIRFVRNESQRQFWDDMWFMNIILKDRQRGFSTLIAMFILDYCLFNSGTTAGIIDLTIDDAKKKLKKIKFAYDLLPDFIKDAVKIVTDNKEAIEWGNGSSVNVGTSHRGGTLQILHISEMGAIAVRFPERAKEIRTGALNTVAPGQIVFNESTAMGSAGEFFDDCQIAKTRRDEGLQLTQMDYKFHFFSWWMGTENEMEPAGIVISNDVRKYLDNLEAEVGISLSPRKRAWYARKSEQQRDDMMREYPGTPEEAFAAAIEGAYFATILSEMRREGRITDFSVEPGVPVNTGWDFGISDHMTIWMHQHVAMQDRIIGYISGTDSDVTQYWRELQALGHIWGNHFLAHDAGQRRIGTARSGETQPRTIEGILNDAGMRNTMIVPRIQNKATAIQEAKMFLPKVWINKAKCEKGIDCLQNYRREWDNANGCWKNSPLHDWASHGYDGFETLARGLSLYGSGKEMKRDAMPKWKQRVMRGKVSAQAA